MKLLPLLMFVLAGCTKPATLDLQINSEADSLYEEACAHYENEEIDSCTYKLAKALELYRESGENEKVAITCLSLGQSYNGIAQTDSARPYLLEGLKYCEGNTALDSIRGRLLTDLASCYMIEGDIREATSHYLTALDATSKSGDSEAYLTNCSSLGVAYRRINLPDSALYYYSKGLEAAMKSKDYSAVSNLHANIAVMYISFKQLENAREHAQEAITYALKEEDALDWLQAYYICGSLLVKTGEYDQAINYLHKAYGIASQQQSPRFRLKVLSVLLLAFQATAQDDSVRYYLNVCDRFLDELPETSHEAIGIYETKAQLLLKEKKYRESLDFYRKLTGLISANSPTAPYVWYSRMAECYHNLQQPDEAYRYMGQALELRDSLAAQEVEKQMSELQVRYDTQKKELEIKRLKELQQQEELRSLRLTIWFIAFISFMIILLIVLLYKRKLQLSRKYIDGMENERARLARELHDGVCNELLGLEMELKSGFNREEDKCELLDKLGRSRANIRSISHELMPPVFSDATIDEIITDYIDHLNIPSSMHLSFDASTSDWSLVSYNVAYELYRIVQESMNNILKYSSGTQISISLLMDGAHVRLEIFSNGVMKRSSSKGIGMRTMEDRVRCMNGTLHVTADETGVCVTVTAPIK
ncbi:hypothetical protein HMPREF1062_01913 [Bacteroides cellulosilyticus CL02T12C19]|uniref:histidine kinase n=1 Tax=Bacteroides cellulosilyticus CL02T12C19 TaxID=997874 RepID=I9FID7_9BACE|nr:tetratricopeptide repeat protein [Bacteroides cellulosilyticus]EIY33184.1 hypothetical protein HMPREF1062_01913 [Bacteroides cellulosilyticus CL02T12C19]MCB6593039.1 tetratricopeptide repeat protein [Bacteroides cellulosilyticus]